MNPPSEAIGVRSSWEALAMNSRRAVSRRAQPPAHLVERLGELADLVPRADRDRHAEVALGDPLRGLLESAQAAGVVAGSDERGEQRRDQRDPAGDQRLTADQRDVRLDVVERRREDDHPARHAGAGGARSPAVSGASPSDREGGLADPAAADRLDPGADVAARSRAGGGRIVAIDRLALELGVGDHEGGLPVSQAEQRDPRIDVGRAPADQCRELALLEAAGPRRTGAGRAPRPAARAARAARSSSRELSCGTTYR